MLRPETDHLEIVISELLTTTTDRPVDHYTDWQYRAIAASQQLARAVNNRYFSSVKDQAIGRYVRYHQIALTLLSDRLHQFLEKAISKEHQAVAAVGAVLQELQQVIDNFSGNYNGSTDTSTPVTRFFRQLFLNDVEQRLQVSETTTADDRLHSLLAAVSISLRDLSTDAYLRLNILELERVKAFADLSVDELRSAIPNAERLFKKLYTGNFNSSALAEWYQQQLLAELSGLASEELASRLAEEEQLLLMTGLAPKMPLDRRRENITEQLPVWLAKLRIQLLPDHQGNTGKIARMPLELSVAQLGLFLRLCYLTGCFHEHNISAMLRFFSQHFNSKKQDHISLKSLAKAFYGAEQSTAASNRAWLQRMIDHINKKYFPK